MSEQFEFFHEHEAYGLDGYRLCKTHRWQTLSLRGFKCFCSAASHSLSAVNDTEEPLGTHLLKELKFWRTQVMHRQ